MVIEMILWPISMKEYFARPKDWTRDHQNNRTDVLVSPLAELLAALLGGPCDLG